MRCKLCFLNLPICSLRGRPMNKNTSPGPFSGQGHQNCQVTQTGLPALACDVRGFEGVEAQLPLRCFCKEKKSSNNTKIMFFEDGRPIVALPGVSLEPGSRGKVKYVYIDTINALLMVNINTEFCFLKCYVMQYGRQMSWFQRNCCLRCWRQLVYSKRLQQTMWRHITEDRNVNIQCHRILTHVLFLL